MTLASIPSPAQGVWHLGPLPIRAYALCIIAGVVVAIWLGSKRWVARGGREGTVADVAVWAIPFGLVGARIYHVATNPELYFAEGRHPIEALYIWNGGLGIWGAIGLGAFGAWLGCRHYGASFRAYGDALAPGILLAQAIGRLGNYFNQELFGKPTDLPWGLEIDLAHRPAGYEQFATFHPTFLYEALWSVVGVCVLLWVDRRFKIGYGRLFALYVMIYTAGRSWVEYLRIDDAHHFLGLRLNDWTSLVCFLLAAAYFVVVGRLHPGRQDVVQWDKNAPDADADADADAESTESELSATDEAVATEAAGDGGADSDAGRGERETPAG